MAEVTRFPKGIPNPTLLRLFPPEPSHDLPTSSDEFGSAAWALLLEDPGTSRVLLELLASPLHFCAQLSSTPS